MSASRNRLRKCLLPAQPTRDAARATSTRWTRHAVTVAFLRGNNTPRQQRRHTHRHPSHAEHSRPATCRVGRQSVRVRGKLTPHQFAFEPVQLLIARRPHGG
jgi:hypothetical protein